MLSIVHIDVKLSLTLSLAKSLRVKDSIFIILSFTLSHIISHF